MLSQLIPVPAVAAPTTTVPDAGTALVPGGQVGRLTRWVALAVIFFLADAVQLLLLLPDRTGELFAWAINPHVTSFVLGAAYVAGAYFFIRVVMVDSWHRVAAGFPAVIVFVWGAAGATALHLDRFIHDGLSFAAWAGIYAIAPVGLPLLYLARRRAARALPLADTPLSSRTRILLARCRRRRRARRPARVRASPGGDRPLALDADAAHRAHRRHGDGAVRQPLGLGRAPAAARRPRASRSRPTASASSSC